MPDTYRHITNLRTPFDRHDWTMLHIMDNWRLGDPVQAKPSETEKRSRSYLNHNKGVECPA